ncbi:MAG TPA: putative toxin-antitoxin system toxin component, PIN family [Caballeronia sp.]|nr:putative toxin-antitoxin system toxin component, PIN family [Caballeronia sp.]
MRLAIDSNIVMSGMLWGGKPALLLDLARQGRVEIYTCPELLAELANAISRPKFHKKLAAAHMTAQKLITDYAQLATVIIISTLPMPVSRDPDDDIVLAMCHRGEGKRNCQRRQRPAGAQAVSNHSHTPRS